MKRKYRATTTAFTSGNGVAFIIPRNIVEEFGIDTKDKRPHFDIYTTVDKEKKEIIYSFTKYSDK